MVDSRLTPGRRREARYAARMIPPNTGNPTKTRAQTPPACAMIVHTTFAPPGSRARGGAARHRSGAQPPSRVSPLLPTAGATTGATTSRTPGAAGGEAGDQGEEADEEHGLDVFGHVTFHCAAMRVSRRRGRRAASLAVEILLTDVLCARSGGRGKTTYGPGACAADERTTPRTLKRALDQEDDEDVGGEPPADPRWRNAPDGADLITGQGRQGGGVVCPGSASVPDIGVFVRDREQLHMGARAGADGRCVALASRSRVGRPRIKGAPAPVPRAPSCEGACLARHRAGLRATPRMSQQFPARDLRGQGEKESEYG